jgi:hypothetical protein
MDGEHPGLFPVSGADERPQTTWKPTWPCILLSPGVSRSHVLASGAISNDESPAAPFVATDHGLYRIRSDLRQRHLGGDAGLLQSPRHGNTAGLIDFSGSGAWRTQPGPRSPSRATRIVTELVTVSSLHFHSRFIAALAARNVTRVAIVSTSWQRSSGVTAYLQEGTCSCARTIILRNHSKHARNTSFLSNTSL